MGKLIVIIEDNRGIMELLNFLVFHYAEDLNFSARILYFFSAEDFLSAELSKEPDLILSDVNLGYGKSGLELLSELREKFSRTKYIIMSGDGENRALAMKLKADGFLEKPFRNWEIKEILKILE